MMRTRWTVLAMMAALLPMASCRKPAGPPVVTRASRMAAPTSQETIDANNAELRKDLDPVPPLKNGKTFLAPDGESWTRFDNGVMVQEIHVGLEGYSPRVGQTVSVNYVGTFPVTNKEFDRSKPGQPLTFKMGSKNLIRGFSIGISTMHVGGKRRVYLPPELAYGEKGGSGIPPHQPLIFEIELLTIKGEAVELPLDEPMAAPMGPPAPGTTSSAPAGAGSEPAK